MRLFQNSKLLAACAALVLMGSAAEASVSVRIDVSSQTMTVNVGGSRYATWRVSTGRAGYSTPRGTYGVQRMARTYFSRKYDNAPMPHSLFFKGGYAVHGTYEVRALGRPASRGCVRLAPANAARLFQLVRQYGARSTRITITN